ncbi:DUF502 domain-containing protein [Wenzhouxiangella sp. XN79A]|uniref:DUF502 domain-containing protein n=1 Tax=Wenzhouxiangella sp. XN79A TaxID=2724193 RepID=UPI00144A71E9|nr:DUF502 domain-containing protein [Wenzhouxiangella sp. XN79A]NKI35973.1 DUF502 domain-containing protein [Wenzhouxiangella sp. XN79A]
MSVPADDDRPSLAQRLVRLFLKGLATIIPIALTLLIVFWLAGLAEGGVGAMIRWVLPDDLYIRGMGLIGGILIVMAIGLLSQVYLFRKLIDLGEAVLDRLPLIKPVFRATKDFVDYFSDNGGKKFDQAVLVRQPELGLAMVGYVTREDFSDLPFGKEGEVAVYLPLSYQVAGYMIIVPRDWLEPIDMPFDESLRFVLTAGMSRRAGPRD